MTKANLNLGTGTGTGTKCTPVTPGLPISLTVPSVSIFHRHGLDLPPGVRTQCRKGIVSEYRSFRLSSLSSLPLPLSLPFFTKRKVSIGFLHSGIQEKQGKW